MPATNSRKILFDTIRAILRRGFRQSEVKAIDGALDALHGSEPDTERDSSVQDRVTCGPCLDESPPAIGPRGTALIKRFEGCARLRPDGLIEAYPDPGTGGDPWTIGWGATGPDGTGGRIAAGTVWSQDQCDTRLENDLKRYAQGVARAIGDAPTTQNQFDAMVSFHYNTGAIARATLTRRHVASDYEGAAAEFARWNMAGGRVLKGLVRRRSEEAALYRRAD
ncbi:lysozyme [Erythrobacter rubeus]|uniref:Lysozyme n=1 Tax=Erythrobacter rubeus TaxID=2760803 RepID=A0ABR8KSY9_9SPHN|nr:lysozyme [Erythrobacter rubeus]MBD2842527.1 lysozyme [Erythrobacter rubeus]